MKNTSKFQNVVIATIVGWLVLFVFLPNLMIIATSFLTRDDANFVKLVFTLDNYSRLLDPLYYDVLLHSLNMALLATLACLALGYPFAWFLARLPQKVRPLLLFLLTLTAVTLVEALRPGTLSVGRVVTLALGVLLAFLGNRLPKVKSNFFLGFRTPWTLSDPDVWNRTHRAGGILFFALGAALVPCGLFLPEQAAFGVLLAGVLAAALTPVVLSYIWYRQKVDKDGRR